MSIKHKIKFKNENRDKESVERDVPADDMKQPIWINEDEEYCKHLARFFKGEVE